jgi:CheY-like chemotaxis protein
MERRKGPLSVLIVEDEALLAMDIESMVEDCGHHVVAEATSLYDVQTLADDIEPDLAFVDIQLARGTSGLDVSALIQQRWAGAIIVFVTANPRKIPEDFAGAHGVIPKPFSRSGLMTAMNYIVEGVCDPPPHGPQPVSFIASRAFAESWK